MNSDNLSLFILLAPISMVLVMLYSLVIKPAYLTHKYLYKYVEIEENIITEDHAGEVGQVKNVYDALGEAWVEFKGGGYGIYPLRFLKVVKYGTNNE